MSRGLQTQTGGPDDANQGDSTMKYLNEENVRSFLKSRTDVLEKVIMEEVDPELLERWTIRKTQRTKAQDKANSCRKTSLSRWKVLTRLNYFFSIPPDFIFQFEGSSIRKMFITGSSTCGIRGVHVGCANYNWQLFIKFIFKNAFCRVYLKYRTINPRILLNKNM